MANFIFYQLHWKAKNKENEAGNGPIKKANIQQYTWFYQYVIMTKIMHLR